MTAESEMTIGQYGHHHHEFSVGVMSIEEGEEVLRVTMVIEGADRDRHTIELQVDGTGVLVLGLEILMMKRTCRYHEGTQGMSLMFR